MQLKDLVKPINEMTDAELIERLRTVRANRHIIRPAHKAHVERAEKKATRGKTKKITDLFEGMSAADREALIKELEAGQSE